MKLSVKETAKRNTLRTSKKENTYGDGRRRLCVLHRRWKDTGC